MRGLTKKQRDVLDYIRDYVAEKRFAPSYREMMAHFHFRSPSSVYKYVKTLHRKGFLVGDPHSARSIQPVQPSANRAKESDGVDIPLVGTLSSEKAIQLFAENETLSLPQTMVPHPSQTYILRVDGEGFLEEQVAAGDLLIVEGRAAAEGGETVIALIADNVVLIKRAYFDEEYIRLESLHRDHQPIILHQEDIDIQGIILGVFRSFLQTEPRT